MTETPFHALDRLHPKKADKRAAHGPRDAIAAMVRAWRRERALRATVAKLSAQSDHTLRDIGLHRGDIREGVLARR